MELTPTVQMLREATKRLNDAGHQVYKLAKEKAETERIYRTELAKVMFRMRDEKLPATLIGDLSRGEVADLKFERDLAAEKYRTAFSVMDALKVEISAIQTIVRWQSEVDS